MTLDELAERSGADDGTINALEGRDSQRSKYAIPIARAFGLSLEELMDEGTDHSAKVRTAVAQARLVASGGSVTVSLEEQRAYSNPQYWPFAISPETMKSDLDSHDFELINTYINGLIDGKKGRARKSA